MLKECNGNARSLVRKNFLYLGIHGRYNGEASNLPL